MSGLTIRELFTRWGFVVDDKALEGVDKKLESLKTTVKYVGGAALGAAASIFGLATSAGAAGAELGHAADRIGISVEALQEYQYAARLAGQSNEGFQGSLQTLIKNLFDARRGIGSSREAFYLLGNALGKDLLAKGMSAEETLNSVADGLNLVTDKSRKLELAGQLFGGDAGAMLTTLKAGSAGLADLRREARSTGVVMSEGAVQAAEAYQRALERTKSVIVGLKNTIGVALFPVVEKVMGSFRHWIMVNRQWLAVGLHEALTTLATFVSRVVFIVERAASVANTAAIAFGGWNRVLKVVTFVMVGLLGLKIATFFGSLIMVAVKAAGALTILGNAGLLAQLKLAAIPLAIGAAFIALLLIIEDVVAYFQGRKSITGLILSDFEGLSKGLDKWLDPILEKVSGFGKKIGKKIVEGLSALGEADWKQVGDFVMKTLELILKVSTIPLQIGWAIAGGIMDGLVDGLRKKFPKLAGLLGLNEGGAGIKTGVEAPLDSTGTKVYGVSASDVIKSLGNAVGLGNPEAAAKLKMAGNNAAMINTPSAPALPPGASPINMQTFQIDARQTVNVPAGTPAERIPAVTTDALKDTLKGVMRETNRATAPAVQY